jgi:hypothetical protein
MRLSDFCNRLTTRAPTALSDSRSRAPRAPQPCGPVTLCPRDPVELRLTANLQLRPCHNPRSASWAETRSSPLSDTARYWYESLDRRLSRAVPPVRSLVSHVRACRPISDVPCHDRPARSGLSAGPTLTAARLLLGNRLVNDGRVVETRTPSLDGCPLLRDLLPAPACADSENETTKSSSACHRTRAWRGPASDIVFAPRAPRGRAPHEPNGYLGKTTQRQVPSACLPSTSAIETAHEHNHEPTDPRSRLPTRRIQLALDLEVNLLAGLGPRPPRRPPIPGGITISALVLALRLRKSFHATPAELLRARGSSDERRDPSLPMKAPRRAPHARPKPSAPARSRTRAPCWLRTLRESATQARSTRAPPVTEPPRCRLERPTSPIFCRTEARLRISGSAAQIPHPRIACEPRSSGSTGPRTPSLRRPPAAATRCSRAAPANRKATPSNPLARAEWDHTSGTVGRSSCSRGPTTQGLGHACSGVPRRITEMGDARGAFHRPATLPQPGFRPAVAAGEAQSTAFHQPVESTQRRFRPPSRR